VDLKQSFNQIVLVVMDRKKTAFHGSNVMRPQVLCVTQNGSKELDLRKWLKTWCRSQLPALEGVEGSCWKFRD
jgi:hypothetical protein